MRLEYPDLITEQGGGFEVPIADSLLEFFGLEFKESLGIIMEDLGIDSKITSDSLVMLTLECLGDIMDLLSDRLRSDAVLGIVGSLDGTAAIRLTDSTLE